jgi:rubrerythrin
MVNPFSILELICMIEESMAVLYKQYARCFTEYAEFWEELAGEELVHAELITQMLLEYERGVLVVNVTRQDDTPYHAVLQHLAGLVHQAKSGLTSMREALAHARDLERDYVEQHLIEVFETDHEEMAYVLATLHRDTEHHQQRLEEMIDAYTRGAAV